MHELIKTAVTTIGLGLIAVLIGVNLLHIDLDTLVTWMAKWSAITLGSVFGIGAAGAILNFLLQAAVARMNR